MKIKFLVVFALSLAGCMSGMQGQPGPDVSNGENSNQPIMEAYIEYSGPATRWAGPPSFLAHVLLKNSNTPEITFKPELFEKGSSVESRSLASATQPGTELVRNELTQLSEAMRSDKSSFEGCLNPVRVRLIRVDGSLQESQGCRGQAWANTASEVVSFLASASRH